MSVVVTGELGTVTVPDATVSSLVVRAAEQVPGVRVKRGRRRPIVEVSGEPATATVVLAGRYGLVLPEAARAVQQAVAEALTSMLGLTVGSVDVEVEEVG
jgi:uncharacterized alkaline shock family protein YloU